MQSTNEIKDQRITAECGNKQTSQKNKYAPYKDADNGVVLGIAPNSKNNHLDDIPF